MLSDHAATIARAYCGAAPVQDMVVAARGEQGRVWRLVTDDGTFAVKDLFVRQLPADAAADVAYQEAVLATGTLRLPRPVRTAAGEVLVNIAGHQVRVYDWVDLLPTDTALDPTLIGATLAAVHLVRHEPAGTLHWWYTDPVGAERWTQLLAAAKAAQAPFVEAFDAEIPHLLRLEALLEAPRNLQNCHRDLWADNILPTPGGGVCVIDWENCGLADPAQEIPMVLLDFGVGDPLRVAELYRSYGDAGGPARIRGLEAFTMVIAQFGHFWEAAVEHYLRPDAADEDRAHSLERIADLLTMPLRVKNLEEMLDIIGAAH
ncbi:MAG TPA: aminoglycoside phosphotransferase family protein [Propionibacteriaceae bacterium]|jgi:hypothetical protein|nr:aminoglycoside phosphotransferase family protein [Propionibacteriaceae bacterium]